MDHFFVESTRVVLKEVDNELGIHSGASLSYPGDMLEATNYFQGQIRTIFLRFDQFEEGRYHHDHIVEHLTTIESNVVHEMWNSVDDHVDVARMRGV